MDRLGMQSLVSEFKSSKKHLITDFPSLVFICFELFNFLHPLVGVQFLCFLIVAVIDFLVLIDLFPVVVESIHEPEFHLAGMFSGVGDVELFETPWVGVIISCFVVDHRFLGSCHSLGIQFGCRAAGGQSFLEVDSLAFGFLL
jgi:hypothetical protein